MGLFDNIRCEMPMPNGRAVQKDSFQTKSLWCSMHHFTITAAGRLIFHKRHYSAASAVNPGEPVDVADLDMYYHGDLALHGATPEGDSVSYVVRFTHGAVEWIRPLDSLPELHQQWLLERGR